MKAQLFQAPSCYYTGQQYRLNPNVGLPTLSAVLNQAGIATEVYDLEALGILPDKLAEAYKDQEGVQPDAVGFTVTHLNFQGVCESIKALRPVYDGYIIVGGPEATCRADEVLARTGADALVVGECEGNIVDILRRRPRGIVRGRRMPIQDIPAPLWGGSPARRQFLLLEGAAGEVAKKGLAGSVTAPTRPAVYRGDAYHASHLPCGDARFGRDVQPPDLARLRGMSVRAPLRERRRGGMVYLHVQLDRSRQWVSVPGLHS